jgi:hypothetical protein
VNGLVVPIVPNRAKWDKEKDDSDGPLTFVQWMIEKLRINGGTEEKEQRKEKTGFIKYLEDLKKISK